MYMADVRFPYQLLSVFLGLRATLVMGELGSSVQLLVILVHPDFLNLSSDFSDLGFHSSSHDFVSL